MSPKRFVSSWNMIGGAATTRRGGIIELSDASDRSTGIDATSAAAALDDVAMLEKRTRAALNYGECAVVNFLWAGLTTIGYLGNIVIPRWCDSLWFALTVFGILATFALATRTSNERRDPRPIWVTLVVTVFSYVWFALLHTETTTPRDSSTYFPLCYMLGVMVMGFWIGRAITLTGLAIATLIIPVHLHASPEWFNPLMIVCVGGGLTVSGLIMRGLGAGKG